MNELNGTGMKMCTGCKTVLNKVGGFYFSKGKYRSRCKTCTVMENAERQKRNKHKRDLEAHRLANREYYAANKEKFAEYRKQFRERNPDYFHDYYRNGVSPLKSKISTAKLKIRRTIT